jgi:hypothetical protein
MLKIILNLSKPFLSLPLYDRLYSLTVVPTWLAWSAYVLIGVPIL